MVVTMLRTTPHHTTRLGFSGKKFYHEHHSILRCSFKPRSSAGMQQKSHAATRVRPRTMKTKTSVFEQGNMILQQN